MRKKAFIDVRNFDKIIEVISDKSESLTNYVKKQTLSSFVLYYKYLTHSDLPTFGKATKVDCLEDNLLYYLTVQEMKSVEDREKKPFETTHQSNIGMQKEFWTDLGMKSPRDTVDDDIDTKKVNNYAQVFLVNDVLKYFNYEYTYKVFNKLNKIVKERSLKEWTNEKINLNLRSANKFTEISLTQAVHGLGVSADLEFSKLRHSMFKNDQLFLLIEKNPNGNKLYIMPIKNPRFFTIIGESNQTWEQYQNMQNQRIDRSLTHFKEIQEEIVTRQYQDRWRNQLAEEMMNFTTKDREVFCPFTYISTDFDNVGTLFRASHIKSYSDSDNHEKYDINNGLLLVANADTLFDKYLITVDENKNLVFSFLLDGDGLLKQKLLLNQQIFKDILNEERMKYLSIHRAIFWSKENNRRKNRR